MTQHPRKYNADQVLSDADQIAAHSDQEQSNAGRAASTSDQASADADQRASDLDQAAADDALAAIREPSGAEVRAYEVARTGRIARSINRLKSGLARRNATTKRDVTAHARDQIADDREARGRARDREERR